MNTQDNTAHNTDNSEQNKKKKKKRKNKRKKKKPTQGESNNGADNGTTPKQEGGENSAANANQDDADEIVSDDPEFEEDLKRFSLRLQEQHDEALKTGGNSKLKPNVSDDWIMSMKESASKSG